MRAAAGALAIVLLVVGQNLFSRSLTEFFLRFPGIDKVLHVLEYALVFMAGHALAATVVPDARSRRRVAAAFAIGLALGDESLQRLAPGRSVEAFDLVANLSGIVLGWVVVCRPRRNLAIAAASLATVVATYVTWSTRVVLRDYSCALQYERQHDFVRAREHYQRAFAGGLRSAGLFNEMAWVEVESGVGDPPKAVEYARTALEMQPDSPDVLDTYGWALLHAGHPEEALRMLLEAYERKPQMYCIHYHLGAAYRALGRVQEAEKHFRQQLALAGTREAAFAQRALTEMAGRE